MPVYVIDDGCHRCVVLDDVGCKTHALLKFFENGSEHFAEAEVVRHVDKTAVAVFVSLEKEVEKTVVAEKRTEFCDKGIESASRHGETACDFDFLIVNCLQPRFCIIAVLIGNKTLIVRVAHGFRFFV